MCPPLQGPSDDPFQHLSWSLNLGFLDLFPVRLGPCKEWCYNTQPLLSGTLPVWRQSVCVTTSQHSFRSWRKNRSLGFCALLLMSERCTTVAGEGATAPVSFDLAVGRQLVTELFWGFPLLGPLGLGSEVRLQVLKLSGSDFAAANREHVRSVATSLRPNEHSATMFEEILEECKLGRVSAPFQFASCSFKTRPLEPRVQSLWSSPARCVAPM